jgi:hypothetical protein
MGFYPGSTAFSAPGAVQDDSNHHYTESYTITVSANQFNSALSSVLYDSGNANYTLTGGFGAYEYNCTDAAKSWFSTAGFGLPNAASGIFTNTPGSLGQTIMSLPGASNTPGNAPHSHGGC